MSTNPIVSSHRIFQQNVTVVGMVLLGVAALGLALVHPPAPPDIRQIVRELEPFVGQRKPWSRADLLELRETVEKLLEEN